MRRSRPRHPVALLVAYALLGAATQAGAAPGAQAAPTSIRANASCNSLAKVISMVTESNAAAASQSPSWVPLRANGWTVFAPSDQWTLSASDAGADVNSPNNESDASLLTWYSLGVPWTFKTLGNKFLGHFSRVTNLCRTAVARSASGESQASELTGYIQGKKLKAVLILSILTQTTETSVGESRYLYTPASQWSLGQAETLALIIKRAIQVPQSLG